jgi:hypothetical protein
MTDAELQAIADHFEALPDINDHVSEDKPESLLDARVVDGLLVPGAKDGDALDAQIEAWRVALEALNVTCNAKMPTGFFGGVDNAELNRLEFQAGREALGAMHCLFSVQGRELFALDEGTIGEALLEWIQRVEVVQEE